MQETQSGNNDTAVIDSPPEETGGLDALIQSHMNPGAAKPAPQEPPKVEEKTSATESAKKPVEEPAKRTSIFDKPEVKKPEAQPPVQSAKEEPAADPFKDIKDGDWKALKAAAKAREQAAAAQAEQERKQREAIAAERDTIKKQLDEYHSKVPDTAEVDRLRKEHKELSDRLAILDYQSHPEYRQKYAEPKNKLLSEAKQILADNGITDEIDLARLTEKPRAEYAKAVSEITEKLNDFDANEFRIQMRDLQKLTQAEKDALGQHRELLKGLGEQSRAKQRTAFEEQFKNTAVVSFAQKIDPEKDAPAEEVEAIQRFNSELERVREEAEKYAFSVSDERQAASVAIKAANYDFFTKNAFPVMQAAYNRVVADRDALAKKLESLTAVTPKDGVDKGAKTTPSGPSTLDEAIAQTFSR